MKRLSLCLKYVRIVIIDDYSRVMSIRDIKTKTA